MTNLIDRLKRHEAFRARVYDDATGRELKPGDVVRGVPTIGYGTTWITQEEAEWLMKRRVAQISRELERRVPYWSRLNAARREAMVNMAYNLGVDGLMAFKRMHQAGGSEDYEWMADEAMDSLWALQVGDRAEELAGVLRTGEWA